MRLTIITINYNNAVGLRKTIESVINQTFYDYEYVIIDGGSTDSSIDIIKEYADKIGYWVSEPDNGIYNAMNKGVAVAHGEYCNFLNSGDLYCNDDVIANVFSKDLVADIVCGDIVTDKGVKIIAPSKITAAFLLNGTLPHPASFIKKELLIANPYDEQLKIIGDWKFFFISLVAKNATYYRTENRVAVFDTMGISSNDKMINRQTAEKDVISAIIPERILDDYDLFMGKKDDYHRLFYVISHSKLRKAIYRLVLIVLKITTFNRGWVHDFSLTKCKMR